MIEVGRFQLDLDMRTLREGGKVVSLGSRAFDILAVVASAGGRLVTKDELMSTVWPQTIVEENNIQVHLSALRKVLGDDRSLLVTVPGRGYQLVQRQHAAPDAAHPAARAGRRVPMPKAMLIGREHDVRQIHAMLERTHVLTLVGAGGIGKTSLAIDAAQKAAADFREPPCFVELATLRTRQEVLHAIVQGYGAHAGDAPLTVAEVASRFDKAHTLLLLDNAEHVAGHVAEAVEALVAQNDALRVLVTSREPLRIMPEALFRVNPLTVPPLECSETEMRESAAVDLFLQRANSLHGRVSNGGAELRLVAEICRRLDGMPLAIELAAARVLALGVEGVWRRLDDRMAILSGGYRTALPRHQTLRATFDWSFALLDASEQTLFRRLALFGGVFTFEALCAVACDETLSVASAIGSVSELVSKSLVYVEFDGPVAVYRLSECTRAYALEKLQAEGETQRMAARHARHLSACLELQDANEQAFVDARVAFDWAFSGEGDTRLGIELASHFVGKLLDSGLVDECCTRAERALDAIEALPAASVDAISDMRVRAALASALSFARGPVSRSETLWRETLALAIARGERAIEAQALQGLWTTMISSGRIDESMQFAQRLRQCALQHRHSVLADMFVAISQHCAGNHHDARIGLVHAIDRVTALQHGPRMAQRFATDPLVFCKGTLARIVWLEGEPDRAMEMVDRLVDLVRPESLEPSLTHVLGAAAAPLALMSGDLRRGAQYIDIMRSQAALHGFEIWRDYSDALFGYHEILAGRIVQGLIWLEGAIGALLARGFRRLLTPLIAVCAETQARLGRVDAARRTLRDLLDFCDRNGERFFLPEVYRAAGMVALHENRGEAIDCFKRGIEIARAQRARMWELRASIPYARVLAQEGRAHEAYRLIEALCAVFDESSRASDVRALFDCRESLPALLNADEGVTQE
jgi:predicted ATPase/DNA-binding winged helix-turn-helix (wHTH) protein